MSHKIKITNGPSRKELFDGLRLFSKKRTVNIIVEDSGEEKKWSVTITNIGAEGRSGHDWKIGFVVPKQSFRRLFSSLPFTPFVDPTNELKVGRKQFLSMKARYSTRIRKGIITIE